MAGPHETRPAVPVAGIDISVSSSSMRVVAGESATPRLSRYSHGLRKTPLAKPVDCVNISIGISRHARARFMPDVASQL
eukprot:4878662-Pleurochrysis_carterae.AAC.1